MKPLPLLLVAWIASAPACAAEFATLTLADAGVQVLRGITWYRADPGMRIEAGDIVQATDKAQFQFEFADGIVDGIGPVALYAPPAGKNAPPAALDVRSGWLKTVARVDHEIVLKTPVATFFLGNGIIVVHAAADAAEVFVESGTLRVREIDATGKEDAAAAALRAGEYWSRSAAKPGASQTRASAAFVAAMPGIFKDALPVLADRYKGRSTMPGAERDILYEEARPWLLGPYRKDFVKRFQPRLHDAAFRAEVDAHASDHPEWDRILHPDESAEANRSSVPAADAVRPPIAATAKDPPRQPATR